MLAAGCAGFEEARVDRIFNRRLTDRQPAAVVRPTTEAEVVDAVRLARARGWQVAVRSGGHSWAQWSVRSDALVIDLGGLKEMAYDEATGIVTASPSTKGGAELAPYLAERGRFFLGGHCPTVGIGGFLLQGGQGWNARGWGWAAEYVVAVDVVTAAGELVRCSADRELRPLLGRPRRRPRLPWRRHPLPPADPTAAPALRAHRAGLPPRRLRRGDDLAARHPRHGRRHRRDRRAHQDRPRRLARADPAGHRSRDGRRRAEADRALAPFRTNPALDRAMFVIDNEPTTPEAERARQLEDNPEGHRWAVDNAWLSGSAAEVVPAMRRAYTTLPNAKAFTIWFSMAPLRGSPTWPSRCSPRSTWRRTSSGSTPEDDDRCIGWLEGAMADLEPVTVGQYLGDSDHTRRQVKFMSDEAWARLQQVCADRDPDRLFVGYLGDSTNRNHWEQRADLRLA